MDQVVRISIFKYRINCKFAFVVIVLAFKQNRLKLKGSSNYVAPVNSRPAGRGRVKPSNLTFFSCQTPYIFVGCNSLHPEELAPNAQNNECSYWCLQIWLRILHNWHFLKYFVQIPKKIYMQPAQKKLHPGKNFIHPAKI